MSNFRNWLAKKIFFEVPEINTKISYIDACWHFRHVSSFTFLRAIKNSLDSTVFTDKNIPNQK